MAWTYEQNFDSLDNGTLGGQDSWFDTDADQRVQDSVAFGGSGKAVIMDGTVQAPTSYRNITAVTSGTVYFAIRWGVNGEAGDSCRFLLSDGANRAVNIKGIDDGGTMKWYQKNGGAWVYWFTPTVDTWYIIRVDFDSSTDKYDCNYKEKGGSWNTAVTNQDYDQASGDVSRIAFTNDAGNTNYFDEISASDPDGVVTYTIDTSDTLSLTEDIVQGSSLKVSVSDSISLTEDIETDNIQFSPQMHKYRPRGFIQRERHQGKIVLS